MPKYTLPKPTKCRYCEDENVYGGYCYTCNQVQPKPLDSSTSFYGSNKSYGKVNHRRRLDQIDNERNSW